MASDLAKVWLAQLIAHQNKSGHYCPKDDCSECQRFIHENRLAMDSNCSYVNPDNLKDPGHGNIIYQVKSPDGDVITAYGNQGLSDVTGISRTTASKYLVKGKCYQGWQVISKRRRSDEEEEIELDD